MRLRRAARVREYGVDPTKIEREREGAQGAELTGARQHPIKWLGRPTDIGSRSSTRREMSRSLVLAADDDFGAFTPGGRAEKK